MAVLDASEGEWRSIVHCVEGRERSELMFLP